MSEKKTQRAMMRRLFAEHTGNETRVLASYVAAELSGEVERRSNVHGTAPEVYARALWRDGTHKGWLHPVES